jgi:hypothetical protein
MRSQVNRMWNNVPHHHIIFIYFSMNNEVMDYIFVTSCHVTNLHAMKRI